MATWIGHLRIADKLLEYGFELEKTPFLLGNIAPDISSIAKKITHCIDDYNNRIQPEDFYDSYLRDKSHDADTFAFLVGYYVHLLADVEWVGNVWRPMQHHEPELAQRIEDDPQFAYEFKRLEYFGHDFLYLRENPAFDAWQCIQEIDSVPRYLEILPGDLLQKWLDAEVKSTYEDSEVMQKVLEHNFPYLTQQGMQTWLHCTITTLVEMLKGKHVPCPNPHPLWAGYIQPYA